VGVSGSTGVRLRAPVEGSEVTTSGSSRLFSAWSIAAAKARGADESMGAEKIRLASLLQTGHVIDFGAVPSGRITSNTPSWSHRYSYVATAVLSLTLHPNRERYANRGVCDVSSPSSALELLSSPGAASRSTG
jgi:hypothetical protein